MIIWSLIYITSVTDIIIHKYTVFNTKIYIVDNTSINYY